MRTLITREMLNQTTEDWHTNAVTLSATKGLGMRFFATLRMTRPSGHTRKCTNVMWFDLDHSLPPQAFQLRLAVTEPFPIHRRIILP